MKTIDDFRQALASHMKEHRITQVVIWEKTGVPQYAISRFLSGKDLPGRYLVPLQAFMSGEDTDSDKALPAAAMSTLPPSEARP